MPNKSNAQDARTEGMKQLADEVAVHETQTQPEYEKVLARLDIALANTTCYAQVTVADARILARLARLGVEHEKKVNDWADWVSANPAGIRGTGR